MEYSNSAWIGDDFPGGNGVLSVAQLAYRPVDCGAPPNYHIDDDCKDRLAIDIEGVIQTSLRPCL